MEPFVRIPYVEGEIEAEEVPLLSDAAPFSSNNPYRTHRRGLIWTQQDDHRIDKDDQKTHTDELDKALAGLGISFDVHSTSSGSSRTAVDSNNNDKPQNDSPASLPTLADMERAFDLRRTPYYPGTGLAYYKVQFQFVSNLVRGRPRGPLAWAASLYVFTTDVARLMRVGFDWGAENIVPAMSSYERFSRWPTHLWLHSQTVDRGRPVPARRYFLVDREARDGEGRDGQPRDGQPRHWVGCLVVHAPHDGRQTLSRFRVTDLTRDHIYSCYVYDKNGSRTYSYHAPRPERSINAIYDDRPLTGWWPWPRQDSAAKQKKKKTTTKTTTTTTATATTTNAGLQKQTPQDSKTSRLRQWASKIRR